MVRVDLKVLVETWSEAESTIGRAAFGGQKDVFVDDFRRSNSKKHDFQWMSLLKSEFRSLYTSKLKI